MQVWAKVRSLLQRTGERTTKLAWGAACPGLCATASLPLDAGCPRKGMTIWEAMLQPRQRLKLLTWSLAAIGQQLSLERETRQGCHPSATHTSSWLSAPRMPHQLCNSDSLGRLTSRALEGTRKKCRTWKCYLSIIIAVGLPLLRRWIHFQWNCIIPSLMKDTSVNFFWLLNGAWFIPLH